jgi:hypothetical protein
VASLVAGGLYAAALYEFFGSDYASDPAYGVWAGAGGMAAVLVGCLVGTRRRPATA